VPINEGEYRCSYCGALVDIPRPSNVTVRIEAPAGNFVVRTLVFDEEEVHSCAVNASGA
jgi:hypothetical protein